MSVAVFLVLALSFATQSSQPFATSEARFADRSADGLSIVPASCPSSPHYRGQCSVPSCTLYPSTATPQNGQSITLYWSVTRYATGQASGEDAKHTFSGSINNGGGSVSGSGSAALSGQVTVTAQPYETTYTLDGVSSYSPAVAGTGGTKHIACSTTVNGARQKYACVNNQCVANSYGPYTTSSCGGICESGGTRYGCVNNQCVVVAGGPYTNAGCNNVCASSQTRYSCTTHFQCVLNPSGSYLNAESCLSRCKPSCPADQKWDGTQCVDLPMTFEVFDGVAPDGQQFVASGHLQALPLLVRVGSTVRLYWNVKNAASCSITGSNGDSWSGSSSGAAGNTSSAIQAKTTYTLNCTGRPTATPRTVTESVDVNVVPVFQEL